MSAAPRPLILIVEDDQELSELISQHLELEGMQARAFDRCEPALRYLERNFANLLLLDLNLPDSSGFDLMGELKQRGLDVPTIVVSGSPLEADKVRALSHGGDDYVTKPFSFPELVARIQAVLRRAEAKRDLQLAPNVSAVDQPFDLLGAKVHPERMVIEFPDGASHRIGRKELGILSYLNTHRHVVITRRELIHSVWGIHADVRSRSLDQYIVKLRAAFARHGVPLAGFKTVHGIGYVFEPPPT